MDHTVLTVFFSLGLRSTVCTHSATQGLAEALQRLFTGFQGLRLNAGSSEDGFVYTQLFFLDSLENGRCESRL